MTEPRRRVHAPADVEADLAGWLHRQLGAHFGGWRLAGEDWEWAECADVHDSGTPCRCDGEVILRRRSDGLVVEFDIDVSAWELRRSASERRDG